jgi:hypothetical protein
MWSAGACSRRLPPGACPGVLLASTWNRLSRNCRLWFDAPHPPPRGKGFRIPGGRAGLQPFQKKRRRAAPSHAPPLSRHVVSAAHPWLPRPPSAPSSRPRGCVRCKQPQTGRVSFRAERPAPSPLREAPGRAVEESLFDRQCASPPLECGSLFTLLALAQEGCLEGLPPSAAATNPPRRVPGAHAWLPAHHPPFCRASCGRTWLYSWRK